MILNNRIRKVFTLLCIVSLYTLSIAAQEKDFGIWTSATFRYDPFKKIEFNLELCNRLDENASRRDDTFLDLTAEYKGSFWSAALLYRFSNERDVKRSYDLANRFGFQVVLKQDWKRFSFSLRTRIQSEFTNMYTSENGSIPQSYLRNRLKASYNIKGYPVNPYVSMEIYQGISGFSASEIEKGRYIAGFDYKISKKHSTGLFFLYQPTMMSRVPRYNHILGIEYTFKL